MLLAVFYLSCKLQIASDITQFMPNYNTADERYAYFLDELKQGQTSKLLFLRIRTDTPMDAAKLSRSLKQKILKSNLFETVANGEMDYDFNDFKYLFKYRYLLSPDIENNTFSEYNLRNALSERLDEIRAGMGMLIKQTLVSDPTNTFLNYFINSKQLQGPASQYGVWFTQDKKSALLIAKVRQAGFDIDLQSKAIKYIQKSVSDLTNGLPVSVDISGPGVFAVTTRDKIKRTLTVLSTLGGCLILIILLLAYRSILLVLLVGIPIISAILFATLATNVVFGYIHGITLAFGITLLGVCLDYPVHLFSHLRADQSAILTIKAIWPTLRLGALTTSLGYLVLLWSGFNGLSQLAVFAVVGLGTALVITRWVIPYWVTNRYQAPNRKGIPYRVVENKWRTNFGMLVVILLIGVLVYSLAQHKDTIWEQDISALSPIPDEARMLDRQLRQQLGVPDVNHVFILTNKSPELLLQETERLTSSLQSLVIMRVIQHVYSTTDLLPSQARQRQRQSLLPDRPVLEATTNNVIQDMPFKSEIFGPFIQDVDTSRSLPPLTINDIQATPLAQLINSDFFMRGDQWVSIIRLGGVVNQTAFTSWLEKHPTEKKSYFNLHQTASNLISVYQRKVVSWLIVGGFVMALILLLFTKSFSTTLRVLLAPVLAVIISLGIQVLFNLQLNLFHLLSILLIVGVGVDYSLFFNRTAKDRQEWEKNSHGVMVGASSTLVAFGVLIFSEIPVMVAIGQTVAIGVCACFILALLFAKKQNI